MDPVSLSSLIPNVGFPIALVVYLLVKERMRSKDEQQERDNLIQYVRDLEKQFRDEAAENARKYASQLSDTKEALENNTRWTQHLCATLQSRPCLMPEPERTYPRPPSRTVPLPGGPIIHEEQVSR